jgi:hypothetical protein
MKPLHPATLVPPGFPVRSAVSEGSLTTIAIRSISAFSHCPGCRRACRRVHSHTSRRRVALPMAGRSVALVTTVRRFRCAAGLCGRTIFAERFDTAVLAPWARRTARLEGLVHHQGLVLGGRPGARCATRLMLPVSHATLLRPVRRHGCPPVQCPTGIGIDAWAWRRHPRYGPLICALARRRPIGLLPDRAPATARAWLSHQPQIASIARDRGGAYALAAAQALPPAVQGADRWHLMANASHAVREAVRQSLHQIRNAIGVMTVDPPRLTAAERLQYEGDLRRADANAGVFGLAKDGGPSGRASAARARGAGSCARSGALTAAPWSQAGRVRLRRTGHGATGHGPLAIATLPNAGGAARNRAFKARYGSSPHGQPAGAGRIGRIPPSCIAFHRLARSHRC